MNLLIVESPAKAKTIEKYLGNTYKVVASVGHIRDLPKSNKKAIDIDGGFIPHYEIAKGKEEVVARLRQEIKRASEVVLATDPDREGEAIAWHLKELLELEKPKRIVFNEITKSAVSEALKHPREIDENLRRAQEARRVLDRIVGYDLSGLIWKKLRYGLSAGRVQSPALRIIMEREREIRAFKPEAYWVISADVKTKAGERFRLLSSVEPKDEKTADEIVQKGTGGSWIVKDVSGKEISQTPRAPFITSTLQQAASSVLGYSPTRTMMIAQKLYETGHITYMRTDSPAISAEAQATILAHITNEFGKEYAEKRFYKTKSASAQEAHEAIRPTDIKKKSAGTTPEQKKLYDLIRERALASQMASAIMIRTKVTVEVANGVVPDFEASGSVIKFPGYLAASSYTKKEDVILPEVKTEETLTLVEISSEGKETLPPGRYSEAGLIKELEKRNIGRPSTYAMIIKTLEERGNMTTINRSLQPTDTGEDVNRFLEGNFSEYISDSFTSEMEEELDEIAEGKRGYTETLKNFYAPFKEKVVSKEDIEKITNLGKADDTHRCPSCGSGMVIKLGRTGKFLSCEKFPECSGARTLEGKELAAPKETGETCPECENGKLVEKEGRFGIFIACSNYPKCKYIKKDASLNNQSNTGIGCPACKKGTMVERRGRFGIFYSCSAYPTCKNAIKSKPTGHTCTFVRENGTVCEALMMEGTKTIPERCSDKTCPNHNPHKLEKKEK